MPRQTPTWSVWDPLSAVKVNKINDDLDVLYTKWSDRLRIVWNTWLVITIWSGVYRVWSIEWIYAWWVVTLTDNTTSYISIKNDWTIESSTVWWNINHCRLWKVITAWWVVTSIEQWRVDAIWWNISWSAWFNEITSTVYDWWKLQSLTIPWKTYTITYEMWKIKTLADGTNTWTVNYIEWLLQSVTYV